MNSSIWHDGERAIQQRVGVMKRVDAIGQHNIRDALSDQHRAFFERLYFIIAGTVDSSGAPWATILAEEHGFISAPSPKILHVAASPAAGDPAGEMLREGNAIGLLGIDLTTRRRNRVNGLIQAHAPGQMDIAVEQSFGNCPRYIQNRDVIRVGEVPALTSFPLSVDVPKFSSAEELEDLDGAARALLASTDTFFVASYTQCDGRRNVDVSHRGGKSGFICVGDSMLTIPDFSGNMFFMTLGNIQTNGKAGLMIVDWSNGDILQMTGEAAVVFDSPKIAAFRGAERLLTFRPHRIVRRRDALPYRWMLRDDGWSPSTLTTGDWNEAATLMAATKITSKW